MTKELQKVDLMFSDVRALFDAVMLEFKFTADHLSEIAEIVLHPNFEGGVANQKSNRLEALTES